MSAFPTNSANNTIGGSGPINSTINLEQFHGLGTEGFNDYSKAGKFMQPQLINPINRVEPVHGEESMGLGTSTFLEGAPASRQAIQRTQSENHYMEGGLMRKKSIAQRIRGMSQSKGRYNEPPPGYTPGPIPNTRFQERNSNGVELSDGPMRSPNQPRPQTAKEREANPFDTYEDTYGKSGATVSATEKEATVAESAVSSRERSLSSPRRAVPERRATADNVADGEGKPAGGGFLTRMKSLKGPRRMKSERRFS
jgi:hypothetical protein